MVKSACFAVFCLVATLSPSIARCGQTKSINGGIRFVEGRTWKQILTEAKKERRYIFVDCYASWCGPCKRMEQEVYSREDVGDKLNMKFISVKVQLDTTKSDDQQTRAFYEDAHYIGTQFKIELYPTLLFLSPDGRILKRISGGLSSDDFVKIASSVLDPKNDYYALLEQYNKGHRDLKEMSYLARTALTLLNDTDQARQIAKEYLLNLQKNDWFSVENIEFVNEFTHSSKEPGFTFFYENSDSIDRVMRIENYAEALVYRIVYAELVKAEIKRCEMLKQEPDWVELGSRISREYGKYYADRIILGAKVDWGGFSRDFAMHSRNLVLLVERYSPRLDTGGRFEALYFNNCAWDIFEHSSDTAELNVALRWSLRAISIDPSPDWMDTYANILYKVGRKMDALKWEELAAKLAPNYKAIISNYDLMKSGKPTWILK